MSTAKPPKAPIGEEGQRSAAGTRGGQRRGGSARTGAQPAAPRRRRAWRRLLAAALVLGAVLGAGLALTAVSALALLRLGPMQALEALQERSPVEIISHAYRRIEGHPTLERLAHPPLRWLYAQFVREPAASAPLPDLGKGLRPGGLTGQRYDDKGAPLAAWPAGPGGAGSPPIARTAAATKPAPTAAALAAAVEAAQPGDVIEVAPGRHALAGTLYTRRGGRADAPITLRAAQPGSVTLEVRSGEGMVLAHPHWIIENLGWTGLCKADDECEHALHVVGAARATVVRNNRFAEFSAPLKVNGLEGQWPDEGLLQFNTLANSRPRTGRAPVAFVDLVGASGWQLLDNRFEGFVKAGGDGVSYGLFMKGGGERGRIERNVVVCTPKEVRQEGLRLGISIGNGGTGADYCRDKRCASEHTGALIANNVVAHCNDAGIDIAKGQGALVLHNTLINTQGILLRTPPSEARVAHNLMEGRVRRRQGTELAAEVGNLRSGNLARQLAAPDALDLRWRDAPEPVATPPEVPLDFCARRRAALSEPGAGAAAACGPAGLAR